MKITSSRKVLTTSFSFAIKAEKKSTLNDEPKNKKHYRECLDVRKIYESAEHAQDIKKEEICSILNDSHLSTHLWTQEF